jgi:hypothetical protein
MEQKSSKNFKALGFIEVLIAIVVVGIVSAVFLTIAGDAMKELIQTERMEYMTRLARDAVNVAQEVANREKANIVTTQDTDYFPNDEDLCYIPMREGSGEDVEYKFLKEGTSFKSFQYPSNPRDAIVEEVVDNTQEGFLAGQQYFVTLCIEDLDETTGWANVVVWVGDTDVAGVRTNDSDLKDFKFYAVIDL